MECFYERSLQVLSILDEAATFETLVGPGMI